RAREPADHVALGEPPHLARIGLDDGLADRDLPVAADRHGAALADRQDRGAVPGVGFRLHGDGDHWVALIYVLPRAIANGAGAPSPACGGGRGWGRPL